MGGDLARRVDFDLIRYAQCWEDADILLRALSIGAGDVCLSIASAGDNALSMLSQGPSKVIALDLSQSQIECLALRVAAYRHLDHGELLALMGSMPCSDRRALFDKCRPSLEDRTVAFWESKMAEVQRFGIAGIGKFESYFRLFRRVALPLVHSRRTVEALLTDKPAEQRAEFYDARWNSWRWRLLLKLFFSRTVMGRRGRDPAFFKYAEGSVADHVDRRVSHAFQVLNPAENPYLQWILTGRHVTALPHALRPENFAPIRDNLDRLEWRRQSVEDFAACGERIDAANLSDIFEYMSEEAYTDLYAKLIERAAPGARFVYWNMMVPRFAPPLLDDRLRSERDLAESLFREDKAFFYSRFVVEVRR